MTDLIKIITENKALLKEAREEPLSVRFFSNITLDMIKPFFINSFLKKKININIEDFHYDSMGLDSSSVAKEEIVILHIDSLNLIGEPLNNISNKEDEYLKDLFEKTIEEFDLALESISKAKEVYISTMSYSSVEHLNGKNRYLKDLINAYNLYIEKKKEVYRNIEVIDIDRIIFASTGVGCINHRELFNSVAPYKFNFLKLFSDEIAEYSSLNNGKVKKVLALDCDNTLWDGTIAEDGQEGIKQDAETKVGKIFKRIQEDADYLANNGAIVCLASKNFESDVIDFFQKKHTHLSLENISAYKVNWQDKATNLKELAIELNLGIDSFIFIDDTDHEINLVKEEAPEVLTLQVPVDTNEYPAFFTKVRDQFYIQKSKTNKAQQYRQMFERNKEMSSSESKNDFLKKLDITLKIYTNDSSKLKRLSELTQKTNQFNMTTKRYTEADVEKLFSTSNVFCFEALDRFGESGVTGMSVVKTKGDEAVIDSFLLSCRILGRNIEVEFLNQILIKLKESNVKIIKAKCITTEKNKKFSDFYEKNGFKKTNNEDYEINLQNSEISSLDYIKVLYE